MDDSTTGKIIKPRVVHLLITHSMLLVFLLLLLWFVVPVFQEMCSAFGGRVPNPTAVCEAVSSWIRHYWYLALPIVVVLLFIDTRTYLYLFRRGHKLGARMWSGGIFWLLMALIPVIVWAMFLPIFISHCGVMISK